jgi:ubiquinone/menaquinone biosynthesis C-methylase UbiE
VGSADHIDLPDKSVDLIVSAQAVHWFNHEGFYGETKRLLKPDGMLAVWGYGLCEIENKAANDVLQKVS